MTEGQFEVRKERSEREVFVITATQEGWRVRSARQPSRFYVVSGNGTGLHCTCPDFEKHATQDPAWQCKHVLAVDGHQPHNGNGDVHAQREQDEERAAIQGEAPAAAPPTKSEPDATQMLIKRSISPDGRIDSVSIEFSFALVDLPDSEVKIRALKTLKLQTEIVKSFLNGGTAKPTTTKTSASTTPRNNGVTFGRLIDVGVSNGQYGERFYVNVQVNGRRARFFGSVDQIAKAITAAGEQIYATAIQPGMRLNLPCRVVTQQTSDGRYLNVTQVLPLPERANGEFRQ
jgi:hypothetical protein